MTVSCPFNSGKQEMLQIKREKEEMDQSHKEQLDSNDTTIKEKGIVGLPVPNDESAKVLVLCLKSLEK